MIRKIGMKKVDSKKRVTQSRISSNRAVQGATVIPQIKHEIDFERGINSFIFFMPLFTQEC